MSGSLKSLKAKKFIPMLSDRQKRFETSAAMLPTDPDQARVIAKALHPKRQYLKVANVIDRGQDCKSF